MKNSNLTHYKMKKIIVLLLMTVGLFSTVQAQEIKWMTLEEALTAQKKNPKPIFMDVYTDWCGPCKMLDKNTFHDKSFVDYISANYYAVRFNAEGNSEVNYKGVKYKNTGYVEGKQGRNNPHDFSKFLQVKGYPTMYVFDTKGEVKNNLVGFRTPEQLLPELKK